MDRSVNEVKDQAMPKIPLAVDHAVKEGRNMFSSMEKPLEETYDKIKTRTVEAYDSSIQYVRQNPVRSLAVALGVGLATGYILKRRK